MIESAPTSPLVRDYVFPIMTVDIQGTTWNYKNFLGTGFLIGRRGYALTAGHVIDNGGNGPRMGGLTHQIVGAFVEAGLWKGYVIDRADIHPENDIALAHLHFSPTPPPESFLVPSETFENASHTYSQWCYPEDVLHEIVEKGRALQRPDLIYLEGYVRRRMPRIDIPAIRGQTLFELSTPGGIGASGSPLISKDRPEGEWPVFSIYVGERISEKALSVGYGVPSEAFRDWKPECLEGHSVLEESRNAF
jgi:trypsin-like peptidase